MHWLVQTNLYSEANCDDLIATLERLGLSYSLHKVVPFLGELDPAPIVPDGARVIVMGSYSLARLAARHRWVPGAFLDNLDFEIQREHWGDLMFNADAQVTRLADATLPNRDSASIFIRPTHDTKSFTGEVMEWASFSAWRDRVLALAPEDNPTITADTSVMLCRTKVIYSETRTWIVDGKLTTASGYRVGANTRSTTPDQVDPRITDFAEQCATLWSPNRAYVLDVFDTPDGLKIGEINNLNSAGWYKADVNRLVMALESMS